MAERLLINNQEIIFEIRDFKINFNNNVKELSEYLKDNKSVFNNIKLTNGVESSGNCSCELLYSWIDFETKNFTYKILIKIFYNNPDFGNYIVAMSFPKNNFEDGPYFIKGYLNWEHFKYIYKEMYSVEFDEKSYLDFKASWKLYNLNHCSGFNSIIFIKNNNVIGFLGFSLEYSVRTYDKNTKYINIMSLFSKQRKTGIGTKLVDKLVEYLKETSDENYLNINLTTSLELDFQFYEHYGFELSSSYGIYLNYNFIVNNKNTPK